eukprot:g1184.t1
MPCMIWLAMSLEFAQAINGQSEHWTDFLVLFALQIANGTVAFFEERNAGNAIAALKASLAPKATVKRDGCFTIIDARELVPGDLVNLKLGNIVPADCILLDGKPLQVDRSALTGESLAATVRPGETVEMGCTIERGELEAIVQQTGAGTFFFFFSMMVGDTENVGRFQRVLFRVMLFLMAIAVVLVAIILVKLLDRPDLTPSVVLQVVGVAVVILVASIPIAMQVVATVTMAVGASLLAREKAIVARLSAIEELAGMDILCSDKTGTLTVNKLTLDTPIVFDESLDGEQVIFYAALAAKRIAEGQDAIDYCITQKAMSLGEVDLPGLNVGPRSLRDFHEIDFLPFDPSIKRTEATVCASDKFMTKSRRKLRGENVEDDVAEQSNEKNEKFVGKPFRVTKGAAPVIVDMCVNSVAIRDEVLKVVDELAGRGYRALGVAVEKNYESSVKNLNNDDDGTTSMSQQVQGGKWEFVGVLSLYDPPRHDTKRTIEVATSMNVEVKMITGDHGAIAKETARRLSMGTTIFPASALKGLSESSAINQVPESLQELCLHANGFAEVLPEDKFNIVKVLMDNKHTLGMTGDGVNDAPALKKAHIGIAVEGATDAARAAADIVLTEPGLSTIVKAMVLSRKIFQRVRNYCIFRIAGTIQLIFFFFLSVSFKPGEYFDDLHLQVDNVYLPVIAIVLITLLNDACVLTIARDNVTPSNRPQQWDLIEVFIISVVLGSVACVGSVFLLLFGLHSGTMDRWNSFACFFFEQKGECKIEYPQLLTVLYLKLSLTDFITVFAARTRKFFFSRKPGVALAGAFFIATGSTTFIATNAHFHGMAPITPTLVVMTWMYALVWFILQDIFKVITYAVIDLVRGNEREWPCLCDQNKDVVRTTTTTFSGMPGFFSNSSSKRIGRRKQGGENNPSTENVHTTNLFSNARGVAEAEAKNTEYKAVPNRSYR